MPSGTRQVSTRTVYAFFLTAPAAIGAGSG
jgi:hypothetical protein